MADDHGNDDFVERLTGHPKVGFTPDVCKGCPERGGGVLRRCGLCGCPTIRGFPMAETGRPPANCRRLNGHERKG